MKQIILVRHLETENGRDLSTKISFDPNISDYGKKQAAEVREFLKNWEYEVVYTSVYARSVKTAELIDIRKVRHIATNAFNEYFTRPGGKGVESVSMGIVRAVGKLYSIFDLYESVMLVGHASINKTILQTILNIEFSEAGKYFNKHGEIRVLRYNWKIGDKKWQIIDSFAPR